MTSTKMLMLKNLSTNTNSHFSTYNLLKREGGRGYYCPMPFTLGFMR